MPQHNGVIESALGLLKEPSVAMLDIVEEECSPKLWARAMIMACGMPNVSATAANEGGVSPLRSDMKPRVYCVASNRLARWGT